MDSSNLRAALLAVSPPRQLAVEALALGATHEDAAHAAGVTRESVCRWVVHHPGVQAALNTYRAALAQEQVDQAMRLRAHALRVVGEKLDEGSTTIQDALVVLRIVEAPTMGLSDSAVILDQQIARTRATLPPLSDLELLMDEAAAEGRAERVAAERLAAASGTTSDRDGA